MMKMNVLCVGVTLLGAIAMTACGTTTSGTIHKGEEVAADILVPVEQEQQLGTQFEAELDKELKYHPNPEVQSYIQNLGQKIVARAQKDAPKIKFRFVVVDDDKTVNAFAIPGGKIYIYSGLLKAATSEAEVAGVLGHEVGHVTQRHIAERLVKANGIALVTQMALGQDPGAVSKAVAQLVSQGYLLKFGRDQESESDTVGYRYMVAAGFHPQGMVDFFKKLAARGEGITIIQSHPNPSDRADKIAAMVKKANNLPTYTGAEAFAQFKPKLDVRPAAQPATPPAAAEPAPTPSAP